MSTKEPDKLLDFVTNLAGDRFLKVEKEIGSGYYLLNIGEAERRQAKHDIRCVEDVVVEMVRNSRDAGASSVYVASSKDSIGLRHMTIIDDGIGVPEKFHEVIFDPRVTSKVDNLIEDRFGVHGRGMALYSIRSNVEDVQLVASEKNRGAIFKLRIDTNRLRERKDQSTVPKLKISGEKVKVISGPHNIWRHLTEISLESPQLEVFFGTGAEILAALVRRATSVGGGKPPLWVEAVSVHDPEVLSRKASAVLGLKVSARNCRRIITQELRPAESIRTQLSAAGRRQAPFRTKQGPAGPIAKEDIESFAQAVTESFRNLGEKYFLKVKGSPKIKCSRTTIKIELPVASEDSW